MAEPSVLLVATHNAGKVRELARLLSGLPLRLRLLSELGDIPEAAETGATFAENALGGRPGVYSARYAGPEATYAERMRKLLGELEATGDKERRARFVCVIAVAAPRTGEVHT